VTGDEGTDDEGAGVGSEELLTTIPAPEDLVILFLNFQGYFPFNTDQFYNECQKINCQESIYRLFFT
jgi:hypothetical protein